MVITVGSDNLKSTNYQAFILQHSHCLQDCKAAQQQLLKEFLHQVRQKKRQQLEELNRELQVLDDDCLKVDVSRNQFEMGIQCLFVIKFPLPLL
jgi:hypothetical protein